MINLPVVQGRSCGECTKCCEGYLDGNIRGQEMTLGKPCFLVEIGKGCTDYENRPESPCKTFQCDWLTNKDVPEVLKPDNSRVILTTVVENNIEYMKIIEAGGKLDSEILTWALEYSLHNSKNISWSILGNLFWFGDDEFDEMMNLKHPIHPIMPMSPEKEKFIPSFAMDYED